MTYYEGYGDVLSNLLQQCKKYDTINLVIFDLNGIPKIKSVPGSVIHRVLKEEGGLGIYAGLYAIGSDASAYFPEIIKKHGLGDAMIIPQNVPAYENTWCTAAVECKEKVLDVICDLYWKDKSEISHSPRHLANRLINELGRRNIKIYSALEYEFTVYESDEITFPWKSKQAYSNFVGRKLQKPLYELRKSMEASNLPARTINIEYGRGQMEVTLFPKFGIAAADDALVFKQSVIETFALNNYKATFMSKSSELASTNSGHYNFSLWSKETGKNLFYDPNSEDKLSELAHQFIGGILTHAKALTAFFDPTVNCYRRLKPDTMAPYTVSWNYSSRFVYLRAKTDAESSTYLEVRAPSGACNPYIVLCAVIAAGLDGVDRNIKVPPTMGDVQGCERLPSTLSEALGILRSDTHLINKLGKDFVDHFIEFKETLEVKVLEGLDSFEKEREMYMEIQ